MSSWWVIADKLLVKSSWKFSWFFIFDLGGVTAIPRFYLKNVCQYYGMTAIIGWPRKVVMHSKGRPRKCSVYAFKGGHEMFSLCIQGGPSQNISNCHHCWQLPRVGQLVMFGLEACRRGVTVTTFWGWKWRKNLHFLEGINVLSYQCMIVERYVT